MESAPQQPDTSDGSVHATPSQSFNSPMVNASVKSPVSPLTTVIHKWWYSLYNDYKDTACDVKVTLPTAFNSWTHTEKGLEYSPRLYWIYCQLSNIQWEHCTLMTFNIFLYYLTATSRKLCKCVFLEAITILITVLGWWGRWLMMAVIYEC